MRIFFKGTVQETPVYYLSGRDPKPVLLIFAGIHGDESAGYLTADRYLNLKMRKGTIILVPRLNSPAVRSGERGRFTEDMNRLFDLPETAAKNNPDIKTVNLAKRLINQADYVLNLHQGSGFYSPVWVDSQRNPLRWGQANIIDAPTFNLPDGRKMELGKFARDVAWASNARIPNFTYHFKVNNTQTASAESRHKEQRKSLTYYALTQKNKMVVGLEVTKNCDLPSAISYLTVAVNSAIQATGIIPERLPTEQPSEIKRELSQNEHFENIRVKINYREKLIPAGQKIFLKNGDRLQILSIETKDKQGCWYGYLAGSGFFSGTNRRYRVFSNDRLIIRRDARTVAVVDVIATPGVLNFSEAAIDGKPHRFTNQNLERDFSSRDLLTNWSKKAVELSIKFLGQ